MIGNNTLGFCICFAAANHTHVNVNEYFIEAFDRKYIIIIIISFDGNPNTSGHIRERCRRSMHFNGSFFSWIAKSFSSFLSVCLLYSSIGFIIYNFCWLLAVSHALYFAYAVFVIPSYSNMLCHFEWCIYIWIVARIRCIKAHTAHEKTYKHKNERMKENAEETDEMCIFVTSIK